ncbi:MAG: hypothetical protein NTV46_17870, partial [Verrucomicrobia bacterium]|nr:hypothetical protein [Verrucomicrobiota bacterium]
PPMDADEHRSNQKSLFICVYLRSSAVKTLFSSCLIERYWAARPLGKKITSGPARLRLRRAQSNRSPNAAVPLF